MSRVLHPLPALNRQRGVALIVALMFLIVLTLLGLAVMRGTTLEEKMAGNSRDYNIALQAAEAALRDGENDLKGITAVPGTQRAFTATSFPSGTFTTAACAAGGLCFVPLETQQVYNTSTVDWSNSATTSVRYGTYTGAAPLPSVSQPPRYILELMMFADTKSKGGNVGPNIDLYYVRITARGWGASSQTQIYLQEVFLVPLSGS